MQIYELPETFDANDNDVVTINVQGLDESTMVYDNELKYITIKNVTKSLNSTIAISLSDGQDSKEYELIITVKYLFESLSNEDEEEEVEEI